MSLRNFLFTERTPQKYYRHIGFWFCSVLPFFIVGIIGFYTKYVDKDVGKFLIGQLGRFPNLLIDILFTYIVAYYIIPSYQKRRSTTMLVAELMFLIIVAFIGKGYLWYSDVDLYHNPEKLWLGSWFLFVNFFNDGCLMRCALFLGCRMLKNYYSKQEEKTNILKENAVAELQLLKAQVHPHFLFNTLNNIYSFSLNRSPLAASLVLKLSDTLRYMITECESPLVPLEKELKMLKDYIGLESVRYGTRLNVDMSITGDASNKKIAPLLLIPLVENSFKHGTSQMLKRPWIKISVTIDEESVAFRITNSKPGEARQAAGKSGIGLKNVQKRMQLLYPDEHEIKVYNAQYTFDVYLRVPLHTTTPVNSASHTKNLSEISFSYGSSQ
jgi:two-component system LytT family sensor kinase